MWYSHYESSTWEKVFRYLLGVVITLWIIVSFIMGYFYLLATGSQITKKGGTFVEGIFDQISYLPYLKNDEQSSFYQNFLFRSCLHPYALDEEGNFSADLCRVYTEDNKNFVVRVEEGISWSDGVAVTIDDVFFTYDEIIRQNRWGIQSLNVWNAITVALEDGKVKVEFPDASESNMMFFTNYLLPKHILYTSTLEDYRTNFSLSPIYNSCGSIVPQIKDINSLIFDLGKCEDTNFAFYQIKNYGSFEDFDAGLQGNKKSIVDVYEAPYSLEGFTGKNILTDNLLGIFFNTDSDKMTVRLRRALGGLIHHNFFTGNYDQHLKPYMGSFLNYYVSDGENIQEFINRINLSTSEINTQDLKDSGAKELPESISINGVDRKFVFFMQKPTASKNLEVKFSNEFENIKITAPDGSVFTPKSYNKKDKKVMYKFTTDANLKVGANQYTISGVIKGKTYTIASIDIYVFESLSNQNNADTDRKINVLYYHDPSSLFVVQQMRNIFKANDILENFIFEEIFNPEELEGKLLMGSYDIYIGSINLGIKKDVLALFGTEDPLLNPSRYRNPILSSLIKQYTKSPDQNVAGEITVLLGQDMPLLLLGYTYFPLQIKNNILQSVFYEAQDVSVREWRHKIYSEHALVHNIRVDLGNALSRNNFVSFIHGNISSRQSWLSQRRALFQTTTSQGHSDGIILEDGTRELPTPITIFEGLVTSADTE